RELARADRAAVEQLGAATAAERDDAHRLDAEIALSRERARRVCERAAALERELRPDDPARLVERRTQVLAELLKEAASSYPDDPVVQALAHEAPAPSDVAANVALAARLRGRLTRVYDLEPL